jgi:transposase InsO family protein
MRRECPAIFDGRWNRHDEFIPIFDPGRIVGRHRVARLMQQDGRRGPKKRRYRVRTTASAQHSHPNPIAPNRLAMLPGPTKPNCMWVSELTYVPTDEGWLYVAGVHDRRRLLGCHVNWQPSFTES